MRMNGDQVSEFGQRIKTGAAALVENTVQSVVDGEIGIAEASRQLDTDLRDEIPGDRPTAAFKRAMRHRQASQAIGHYGLARLALPRIVAWREEHESLTVPSDWVLETYKQLDMQWRDEEEDDKYRDLVSPKYWLADSALTFLRESSAEGHWLHAVHDYLDEGWGAYQAAYVPWKRGPGKKRWPILTERDLQESTQQDFIGPLANNTEVGINEMAAFAVHYAITTNRTPTADELTTASVEALPRMRWVASAEKNMGRRRAEAQGIKENLLSSDAAHMLFEQLQVNLTSFTFEELAEPFKTLRTVHDRDFCPADVLRNGPLGKAGACPGDVIIQLHDDTVRQNNRMFFEAMGLPAEMGDTLSMATMTLAMGKRQAEVSIYPRFASFLSRLCDPDASRGFTYVQQPRNL